MSAVVWLQCDIEIYSGEFCPAYDVPLGSPRTATETRARLARQGWHRTRDGRDLCPDCWEKGER